MIEKLRRRHLKDRKGLAPIEYLMFLPIFVVFMLALLWITRVQLTHAATGRAVERDGAQQAGRMEDDGSITDGANWSEPTAPELRQLLDGFESKVSSVSGLVASRSERDTGEGIRTVVDPIGSVSDQTEYLTHAWEDKVFKFPQNSGAQPQLTLPPQIQGIAPSLHNLSAFVKLSEFGGRQSLPPHSALNSLAELTNQESTALPLVSTSLEHFKSQQRVLDNQLQELVASGADPQQIDALTRQLSEVTEHVKELEEALSHLSAASKIRDRLREILDEQ